MSPFYGRERVIGDALTGLFGGIQQRAESRRVEAELARTRAQQDEDRKYQQRQREIGDALTKLQLTQAGVREGALPNDASTIPLPTFSGGMVTGARQVADPSRYTPLSGDFYVDRNATPEFKQAQATATATRQAEDKSRERQRIIGLALQAKDPAQAMDMLLQSGMSGAEAKATLEGSRPPDPKAPVMGSPEWLAAKEAELSLQDRFDQRKEGRAAARKAAEGGGQPDSGETMKWRGDFNKEIATEREVAAGWSRVKSAAAKGTGQMTAADDMALIFGFMKTLDPGSTVREGEFATAQDATGVPSRIVNLYNRALSGERLNPQQRAEMLQTAEQAARAANEKVRSVVNRYVPVLSRYGINPSDVLYTPFDGILDTGSAPPSGGRGANAPVAGGDTAFRQAAKLEGYTDEQIEAHLRRQRGGR